MARLLSNKVKIFYISTSNSEKIIFYFHTGQALSLFLNSAILMGARYFVFITSAFAWLLGRLDVFSYIICLMVVLHPFYRWVVWVSFVNVFVEVVCIG